MAKVTPQKLAIDLVSRALTADESSSFDFESFVMPALTDAITDPDEARFLAACLLGLIRDFIVFEVPPIGSQAGATGVSSVGQLALERWQRFLASRENP